MKTQSVLAAILLLIASTSVWADCQVKILDKNGRIVVAPIPLDVPANLDAKNSSGSLKHYELIYEKLGYSIVEQDLGPADKEIWFAEILNEDLPSSPASNPLAKILAWTNYSANINKPKQLDLMYRRPDGNLSVLYCDPRIVN